MYIREIHIENIRGFDEVHLDLDRGGGTYAGWTVIAGVNGSGKTTFLRALALSTAAVSTALTLVESYDGWLRAGAKSGHAKAHVQRSTGDRWKRSALKRAHPLPDSFWTGLKWAPDREPMLSAMVKLNPRALQAPLLGPCAEAPSGWFLAGYGSFRRITGEAPSAMRFMRGPTRVARLVSLFREEASLTECVRWLQSVDYRSKEGSPADEALKRDVFRILGDHLLPGHAEVDHVDSNGLWLKCAGVLLVHTQVSDGYKTVVALVTDILKNLHEGFGRLDVSEEEGVPRVMNHGVVLIDEIDAHLHISWQKQIGFWLKHHFPNIQFIVTTHSPFICQAADPRGIIRLPAPGTKERTEHVSEYVYNLVVNGTAEDAVMSELFGRERPYSDEAAQLREEISALESRRIQGVATKDENAHLKELLARLPQGPSAQVERALLKLSARLDAKKGA